MKSWMRFLHPDQADALDANTSLNAGNPVASMADVGGGASTLAQVLTNGNDPDGHLIQGATVGAMGGASVSIGGPLGGTDGGMVDLKGGDHSTIGTGGEIEVAGAGEDAGAGGYIDLRGGNGASGYAGGNVGLVSGSGNGGIAAAASLNVMAGDDTATPGYVQFAGRVLWDGAIPGSDPGVAGEFWIDSNGFLKVSAG